MAGVVSLIAGCGPAGLVGALVRVGRAPVEEAFAFVHEAFAFVGAVLAVLGLLVALVGDPVTLVGELVACVGVGIAVIGNPVSVVGGQVPFGRGPATLVRTDGTCLVAESMSGVGRQLPKKHREGTPGDCPNAFGRGELVTAASLASFIDAIGAVASGSSALFGRTAPQLRSKAPLVVGSLAQILVGMLCSAHFGGMSQGRCWPGRRQA